VDNVTLENTVKLEVNESVMLSMETNKIKLDILDNFNCRIVVRGNMQKKTGTSIKDTSSPSVSFRGLKMLLADAARYVCGTYQVDGIVAFLKAQTRSRVLTKLSNIC
jgi:hypothetical protein